MKVIRPFIFLVLLSISTYSAAQVLHFNSDKEFKILQLTDMHLGCKAEGVQPTLDLLKEMIESEKPDFVMFTGDITTQDKPKERWDQIAAILREHKTLWAVTFGNHDDEYDTKRAELTAIVSSYPECLTRKTEGVDGETNFVLPIYNKKEKVAALIYAFDSHAYSRIKDIKGYDWIQLSQLNWYRAQNELYTKQNDDKPLPALAFFHIPFPEYNEINATPKTPVYGDKKEEVACGKINGGLFASLIAGGDVMGTFVGHDHVNDYIGVLHGIALAYGRFSNPTECPYGKIKGGARVIVLKENKRKFETWIRETGGNIISKCTYPNSFN